MDRLASIIAFQYIHRHDDMIRYDMINQTSYYLSTTSPVDYPVLSKLCGFFRFPFLSSAFICCWHQSASVPWSYSGLISRAPMSPDRPSISNTYAKVTGNIWIWRTSRPNPAHFLLLSGRWLFDLNYLNEEKRRNHFELWLDELANY